MQANAQVIVARTLLKTPLVTVQRNGKASYPANKRDRILLKLLFFGGLVALWEGVFLLRVWPEFLLPSPGSVIETIVTGLGDGSFILAVGASTARLCIGYAISLVIGLPLGFAVGRFKSVDETVGAILLGLQTLPSVCWLPLALLWFGLNERAIIFVVIMGAVLSISLSAEDGLKNVNPLFVKAARNMGAHGWKLWRRVMLPAALPGIVTGMKLGWSFAWRSLMAGELLYGNIGLGQLLMMGRELNEMSRVIAVMLIIVALGLIVDRLVFAPVERRLREQWGIAQ